MLTASLQFFIRRKKFETAVQFAFCLQPAHQPFVLVCGGNCGVLGKTQRHRLSVIVAQHQFGHLRRHGPEHPVSLRKRHQLSVHQVIQQNLGQPDRQKQNVTMNTRAILTSSPATRGAGAVSPVIRFSPTVSPCVRWDYLGDSKGQQSVQLYFFNGGLVGYQWINNAKNNQNAE